MIQALIRVAPAALRLLASLLGALNRSGGGRSTPSVPKWFKLAQTDVGFHEDGTNLGIEDYIREGKCGALGSPWCAVFVNAMLENAGVRGTRSAMARSFETSPHFVKLPGPAIGAITTMWRQSPGSGLGHVFFYAGESSRGIYALGGNQDDQVCLQYEPRNRIVGYFWPKSVALPSKIGPVLVSTKGSTVTKET